MSRLRLAALIFFTLTATFAARAQVVGGTISGTVTDATGAVIPNAQVLVHDDDTGTLRTLTTSAAGTFTAPSVAVGRYTVTVSAPGFTPYKRTDVAITIGQTLELTLKLTVTGSETVNVEDTPPAVNVSTEQSSGLVNSRQVKELPLNGRSYDQLLTLNPGIVNYTNQRSGGVGTSNSSVGSMFSVSGRRPQDNLFLLNGIEYTGASLINTTPGGTSGQLLGIDGIREFNVVTDTYSAAYGKRDGAQISIATTGGTNQLHGSVFEFLRNSFFDARNYFDGTRIPEFQRNSFGGSLGGPLRKDKAFLFANYEGYRQNLGESIVTLVPDNQARLGNVPNANTGVYAPTTLAPNSAALLNLWPVANGPEVTQLNPAGTLVVPTGIAKYFGTAPQHIREDFGTTRFDYNFGVNDLFNATYTVDDSYASTPSADPYSYVNESLREQVLSAQEQHIFSSHLLNIARVGLSRSTFYFYGYVPAAQQALAPSVRPGVPTYAVVIAGSTASNGASSITTAGANVGSNNGITRNLFTFDDHAYYTIGKHTIQGGVWAQRLQSNDNLAQDQYGQASFASLTPSSTAPSRPSPTHPPPPSSAGAPSSSTLSSKTPGTSPLASKPASVPQRVLHRMESESQGRAGVYTFTNNVINTTPSVSPTPSNNNRAIFLPEPRVGLAWNVFGNGRTSVRASAGLHHSLLDALDYRLDQAAPFNTVYSYSSTTVANPISGTPLVSPSTIDSGIYSGAHRILAEDRAAARSRNLLTIGYDGSHSYHQILNGRSQRARLHHPRQRHHLLPEHDQGQPRRGQHHLVVGRRLGQLQRPRRRLPPRPLPQHPVPRQLHLVQEPRRRLGLEHLGLLEHAGLRRGPFASAPRLRSRRHGHPPHRVLQRHLRSALRRRTSLPG
jgi:hypothetical protein